MSRMSQLVARLTQTAAKPKYENLLRAGNTLIDLSNLAMMIRRLCSMRIDGTFAITEKKRDEALELLRSMGLQGSPLRDTNGVPDTCGGKAK